MDIQAKSIIYGLVALVLFSAGWVINGWRWESKYLDRVQEARKIEHSLQSKIDAGAKDYAETIRILHHERDSAIERLRQRPERMPEDSRANCSGATGAELSRSDAEAFIWIASRADETRAALESCYRYADLVYGLNK